MIFIIILLISIISLAGVGVVVYSKSDNSGTSNGTGNTGNGSTGNGEKTYINKSNINIVQIFNIEPTDTNIKLEINPEYNPDNIDFIILNNLFGLDIEHDYRYIPQMKIDNAIMDWKYYLDNSEITGQRITISTKTADKYVLSANKIIVNTENYTAKSIQLVITKE